MGRYFGLVSDAVAKGSSYDDLTLGAVPLPVQAWPVTGANVDPGRQTRERANEIRGGRGTVAPTISRHAPSATVNGRLYPELATTLLYMALGSTSRTGTAPAAFTDAIVPAADSVLYSPGAHLAIERDGLFQQVSGAKLRELTLQFPLDEDATFDASFGGLFLTRPSAPTWPKDFTYLGTPEWPLQLRDAKAFENGSPTAVDCLRGFTVKFEALQREPDFCAGKNVETRTVSGSKYRIWWPDKHRVSARRQITGTVEFTGLDGTREAIADVMRAQQLVVEVYGRDMATTPAAVELLRFVSYALAYTGGGPDALTRDDDINTSLEFGSFIDGSGKDLEVEYVNNKTLPPGVPAA